MLFTEVAIDEKLFTIEEYLEREDAAFERHEFFNGTILEMPGGIVPHNVAKLAIATHVFAALKARKVANVALNSDTKIRTERTNSFVYPDLAVSDGPVEYYTTPNGKLQRDIVTNPLLVVEVFSEATRDFDKDGKFDLYSENPCFREYLLIEPEKVWAQVHYLQDPERQLWHKKTVTDRNQSIYLHSLDLEIPLEEIYQAVDNLP